MSELAGQGKIKLDANTAKCLKGMAGEVTEKRVLEHVESRKEKKATAGRFIKLSADVYEKYFADINTGDVAGIVEKALAAWFEKEGVEDVY